ncbi:MAG: hypothetical protein ACLRZ6_09510 [Lachnospiraceae bacterium]
MLGTDLSVSGNTDYQLNIMEKFVLNYLFSFAVGFVFSEFLIFANFDWYFTNWTGMAGSLFRNQLPATLHNCHFQPLWPSKVPTDLFPRELAQITKVSYPKSKLI